MVNVKIDDLANVIAQELENYSKEVSKDVKKAVKEVSAEMTENIRNDSPKHTGDYAKGWTTKKEFENDDEIRIRTYNKTDPQLTHLLEYGHAKVNGGRVEGHPHIQPNEEKAKKELEERIAKAVSGE
jgi:BMFP domain-containing protein YqiC